MWTARFSASEAINSARRAGSAEVSARPCPQVCGFSITDLLFTAFVPVISWQRRRAWCGRLWLFVVVVASDPDVAETSALQYEKQLMLAVVLDLLGMDFFLKQLPILPKPGSDLAGGDLLQG